MPHLNDAAARTVELKLLPDRSGRCRIHWFERRDGGPVTSPEGVLQTNLGPLRTGGVKGRIACQPARASDLPERRGDVTVLLLRSDDPRAVTCPECRATREYWEAMLALAEGSGASLSDDDLLRATAAGVAAPAKGD